MDHNYYGKPMWPNDFLYIFFNNNSRHYCSQSYLYMSYGNYGLGEIRASLIPLAELNFIKPIFQARARALLSFLRLFPPYRYVK